MSPVLVLNSLGVAAASTAIGLGLGLVVAVAFQTAGARARRVWLAATLGVLALPGFFVAGVWMDWVGFAGAWRAGEGWWVERWMPLACTAGVLGLLLWPVTALLTAGIWDRLDGRLLEANPELRGWNLWRFVLWPASRGALGQPLFLTFVLALGNFAVPALFQARVWPAEIWVTFSTRLDPWAALGKGWPLALIAMGAGAWVLRRPVAWPSSAGGPARELWRERWGTRGVRAVSVGAALILGLSLAAPIGHGLADGRTWRELGPAVTAAWPAVGRSALYAAGAATLAVLFGAAAGAQRRWLVLVAFFVLPGVFTGIAISGASAGSGFTGWRETPLLVLAALWLRYAFVGWLAAARAWRRSDSRLLEITGLAGGGRWAEWRHVVWPPGRRLILGGWLVVYVLCLWDVETVLLVLPPGGDSLSVMIFNLLHYGHNAQVNALCVMLGLLAVLPVGVGWLANQALRRGRPWTGACFGVGALVTIAMTGCSGPSTESPSPLASDRFGQVQVIGGRGTGPGLFNKPRSVTMDRDDNLYVIDMTGRVQKFAPDGRWLLLWQMPETDKGKAKGMAPGPENTILVIEPHYHRVNRFAPDGRLIGQWGVHGTNAGQLWFPRSVALGPGDDCFISEYGVVERVQRFSARDGIFRSAFGEAGTEPARFNRAEGLAVDGHGRVYVADSCNHRIQVFSADGRFVRAHGRAGQGPGEFSYPYDIRVDDEGTQYVCEFGNSRVQILNREDRPLEVLGGPGTAPGRMNNPWSLCLDSRGNLYVADSQNHRILKFIRREGRADRRRSPAAEGPGSGN